MLESERKAQKKDEPKVEVLQAISPVPRDGGIVKRSILAVEEAGLLFTGESLDTAREIVAEVLEHRLAKVRSQNDKVHLAALAEQCRHVLAVNLEANPNGPKTLYEFLLQQIEADTKRAEETKDEKYVAINLRTPVGMAAALERYYVPLAARILSLERVASERADHLYKMELYNQETERETAERKRRTSLAMTEVQGDSQVRSLRLDAQAAEAQIVAEIAPIMEEANAAKARNQKRYGMAAGAFVEGFVEGGVGALVAPIRGLVRSVRDWTREYPVPASVFGLATSASVVAVTMGGVPVLPCVGLTIAVTTIATITDTTCQSLKQHLESKKKKKP